jgi:hypothetical protein
MKRQMSKKNEMQITGEDYESNKGSFTKMLAI